MRCCQQIPGAQGMWGTQAWEGLCVRKLKEHFISVQALLTPNLASHQPPAHSLFWNNSLQGLTNPHSHHFLFSVPSGSGYKEQGRGDLQPRRGLRCI